MSADWRFDDLALVNVHGQHMFTLAETEDQVMPACPGCGPEGVVEPRFRDTDTGRGFSTGPSHVLYSWRCRGCGASGGPSR
jgi:hypothetical protein